MEDYHCHSNILAAGSMLRPYISEKNYWILNHHEIFQAYYYGDAMNVDKNIRERFRTHKYFKACEEFCGKYDEAAFDANYQSLPLSEFREMLLRILKRKPYQVAADQLNDATALAKHELSIAFSFEDWKAQNPHMK